MRMQQNQQYKRSPAVKVDVGTILASEYVKEQDMVNYMRVNDFKFSRVNLLAMVIHNPEEDPNSLLVEDGTGKIALRVFEDQGLIAGQEVGSCVQIIGKPREYNGDKYLIPEVIKSVSQDWVKVRQLELEALHKKIGPIEPKEAQPTEQASPEQSPSSASSQETPQKTAEPEVEDLSEGPSQTVEEKEAGGDSGDNDDAKPTTQDKVYNFIKEKDSGDGVDIDTISAELNLQNGEAVVTSLLQNGDVFEIKPGRVKVLE